VQLLFFVVMINLQLLAASSLHPIMPQLVHEPHVQGFRPGTRGKVATVTVLTDD